MMIYHITSSQQWQAAQQRGEYRAESLETEGFIHSSTKEQVLPVANELFRGQGNLLLLGIDPARLTSELKWEAPDGKTPHGIPEGDPFPHIYSPLNLDAVVKVIDLESNPDGTYKPPVDG
jgi:uncharacterized protein (DUF952 family)